MTYKKILILPVIIIMLAGVSLSAPFSQTENSAGIHQVNFFEEKYFNEGISRAENAKAFEYFISGGIVPHDLFAGFIIADFFKRLSSQKPKTIILLGPNHYEKGGYKALTSLYQWETPFGIVNPDNPIISKLIDLKLARTDEETLPNDHAVSGIMPFIKYYLPQTKVVPILLSGKLTQNESKTLADNLSSFVKEDTILVAAVDFSHYLNSRQAQEKDQLTLQVIKDFNFRQLFLFNNDYLDSPPSIGVLLMAMQKLGATKVDLLNHTNSGLLQNNEYIQTTSYFSLAYH